MSDATQFRRMGLGRFAEVVEGVSEDRRELLGEILATLRLGPNRQQLHPKLLQLAERWHERRLEIDEREVKQGIRGVTENAEWYYRERARSWDAGVELPQGSEGGGGCEI